MGMGQRGQEEPWDRRGSVLHIERAAQWGKQLHFSRGISLVGHFEVPWVKSRSALMTTSFTQVIKELTDGDVLLSLIPTKEIWLGMWSSGATQLWAAMRRPRWKTGSWEEGAAWEVWINDGPWWFINAYKHLREGIKLLKLSSTQWQDKRWWAQTETKEI